MTRGSGSGNSAPGSTTRVRPGSTNPDVIRSAQPGQAECYASRPNRGSTAIAPLPVRTIATALLCLALLLAGCGGPAASASPSSHVLGGTFTLTQKARVVRYTNAAECSGTGGYDDIRSGLDVVVRDGAGTIIAKSVLIAAAYDAAGDPNQCAYAFTIAGVPDAPFYSVEVGHRGAVTYSRADLDTLGWKLGLTLGG